MKFFTTLATLVTATLAATGKITTSKFGSCSSSSSISVTQFNAAYYQKNYTIVFEIAGKSLLNSTEKLSASLQISAYGETRFNFTFDPCAVDLPSLCPMLPYSTFTAVGLMPITPQMASAIPSIAYNIPDFDGQAYIYLYDYYTRKEIGCATATVQNGKSFRHGYVSIITGVLAVFAALCSFASILSFSSRPTDGQAVASHSAPSAFTVFSFFQSIALSAAISVTYPVIFVSWASNFSWSIGLIPLGSFESVINSFRTSTGGKLTNVLVGGITKRSFEAYEIVKRGYSPSSAVAAGFPVPGVYMGFQGLCTESNITTTDAFMTSFLWFLIVFASILALIIGVKIIVELCCRWSKTRKDRLLGFRKHWIVFVIATMMRVLFVAFFVLVFLTVYQFTLPDARGPKAVAAVVFALMLILILGSMIYASILGSRDQAQLFARNDILTRWGWLYIEYSPRWWSWFVPLIVYDLVKAIVLATAQGHGKVQSIILACIELIALIGVCVVRPYGAQRGNFAVIMMSVVRFACTAIICSFAWNINGIVRTVLGIVIIVIQGICAIVLVCMIAWNGLVALFLLLPSEKTPRGLRKRQSMYRESVLSHPELKNEKIEVEANPFVFNRQPLEEEASMEYPKPPQFYRDSVTSSTAELIQPPILGR